MGFDQIKELRMCTGAGIMDCKKALESSDNNIEKSIEWLKKNGLARAEKKALRETREGAIASYVHGQGRIGVLVEVSVETDFAARGEFFKTFIHQLSLHIAAMNPLFVSPEDVSEQRRQKELFIFQEQSVKQNKPTSVVEKITQGKMNKWLSEVCLMQQTFLSSSQNDKPQSVEEVVKELIARLGENIVIRRFIRFELGEKN